MVLVVDHTLVRVSSRHGAECCSSTKPPQTSTTGSPSRRTATDAPTSVPASRLADRASTTAPGRLAEVPPLLSALCRVPNAEWPPPSAPQREIEDHSGPVAERPPAKTVLRFGPEAIAPHGEEAASRWRVETADGTVTGDV